jgi:hypothetical protein
MLSEHQCQGWLEGYLLTGRHGFFSCYEAFIHIMDAPSSCPTGTPASRRAGPATTPDSPCGA